MGILQQNAARIVTRHSLPFYFCGVLTSSVVVLGIAFLIISWQKQSKVSIPVPSALHEGDILLLRTSTLRGQIVLRAGDTDKFTHVGIVHIHNGVPYLIHADPESVVRSENMALMFLRSGVRSFKILRVSHQASAHIAAQWAMQHAEQVTIFDQNFRYTTPDTLYCTELVWRAFQSTGIDLLKDVAEPLTSLPLLHEPILLPDTLARSKALISPACHLESRAPALASVRHD